MNRNPSAKRPIYGRDLALLMRDINRIEASLNAEGNGAIDVVIVIDTSGSMSDVIASVKRNVRYIFDASMQKMPDARIGLIEQGDWSKDSVYRCQPTNDPAAFQAGIDAFGYCGGGYEAYVDSLVMAVADTQWRDEATRLIVIIGDEPANQRSKSGKTWADAIAMSVEVDASVAMIIAKSYAEASCRTSYAQATEATGGVLFVAPTNDDVVNMIVLLIGHFTYQQTEFFRYTRTRRESLGMPDGGVSVPAINALAKTPFTPHPIVDMRDAIVRLVNATRLKAPSGQPFTWTEDANNLYRVAMGDRSDYGATGGLRYTWTRTLQQMLRTPPRDVDIGEVYECVRALKIAAGV